MLRRSVRSHNSQTRSVTGDWQIPVRRPAGVGQARCENARVASAPSLETKRNHALPFCKFAKIRVKFPCTTMWYTANTQSYCFLRHRCDFISGFNLELPATPLLASNLRDSRASGLTLLGAAWDSKSDSSVCNIPVTTHSHYMDLPTDKSAKEAR